MRWRFSLLGISVRLDWTLLLAPVLLAGFRFAPVEWLATLALLAVHQLGHWAAVRLVGGRATAIELTGYGGACDWAGHRSPLERAFVAWGGLLAQGAVLTAAALTPGSWPPPLFTVATESNAWLFAVNLVPAQPLDGAQAWQLPWLLGRSLRAWARGQRGTTYETEAGRELDPDDPNHAEAKQLATQLIEQARRDEAP